MYNFLRVTTSGSLQWIELYQAMIRCINRSTFIGGRLWVGFSLIKFKLLNEQRMLIKKIVVPLLLEGTCWK